MNFYEFCVKKINEKYSLQQEDAMGTLKGVGSAFTGGAMQASRGQQFSPVAAMKNPWQKRGGYGHSDFDSEWDDFMQFYQNQISQVPASPTDPDAQKQAQQLQQKAQQAGQQMNQQLQQYQKAMAQKQQQQQRQQQAQQLKTVNNQGARIV